MSAWDVLIFFERVQQSLCWYELEGGVFYQCYILFVSFGRYIANPPSYSANLI